MKKEKIEQLSRAVTFFQKDSIKSPIDLTEDELIESMEHLLDASEFNETVRKINIWDYILNLSRNKPIYSMILGYCGNSTDRIQHASGS